MITPSGSDDTAVIQAALDTNGYAKLAPGDFHITSLNMTNRTGCTLEGCGYITRLNPLSAVAAVIDCTALSNGWLKGFRLSGFATPTIHPSIGILAAQKSGSASSDVVKIDDVRVDGYFNLAALFVLQVQSSMIRGSQFYNYQPGKITAAFTSNNFFGAVSDFCAINNGNDVHVSDWTLEACEFHNFAEGWAFWIGAVDSLRVYGGNMSSAHHDGVVSVNSCQVNGAQSNPGNIIFDGTTFYSDSGVQPLRAVQGMTQYVTFRDNSTSMPLT